MSENTKSTEELAVYDASKIDKLEELEARDASPSPVQTNL